MTWVPQIYSFFCATDVFALFTKTAKKMPHPSPPPFDEFYYYSLLNCVLSKKYF